MGPWTPRAPLAKALYLHQSLTLRKIENLCVGAVEEADEDAVMFLQAALGSSVAHILVTWRKDSRTATESGKNDELSVGYARGTLWGVNCDVSFLQ